MRKSVKVVTGLVVAAWLGGSITALSVMSDGQPVEVPADGSDITIVGCQQEDSCAIDYRDGVWHITRDQSVGN